MESLIYVVSVLAVFAMIHERVLELLRAPRDFLAKRWPRLGTACDALTIGSLNWASAVALALLTHADLLDLLSSDPKSPQFFAVYMKSRWHLEYLLDKDKHLPELLHLLGCVLMGFSTTVGSKFWHDALSGLTDLRKRLKDVEPDAGKLTASELKRALDSAADELGSSKATQPEQVVADTVRALKNAATHALESRRSN